MASNAVSLRRERSEARGASARSAGVGEFLFLKSKKPAPVSPPRTRKERAGGAEQSLT
jgi:hypothetical protein